MTKSYKAMSMTEQITIQQEYDLLKAELKGANLKLREVAVSHAKLEADNACSSVSGKGVKLLVDAVLSMDANLLRLSTTNEALPSGEAKYDPRSPIKEQADNYVKPDWTLMVEGLSEPVERMKQACLKVIIPVGNMSDAPVLQAIKKGMEFNSAINAGELLELICQFEHLLSDNQTLLKIQKTDRQTIALNNGSIARISQLEADKAELLEALEASTSYVEIYDSGLARHQKYVNKTLIAKMESK